MSSTRLVFSTDPRDQVRCSSCNKLKDECRCQIQESAEKSFVIIFRIEKKNRGGKTVTILDGFPRNENYLKTLCKELKAKCGAGGTFFLGPKFGVIEIQGDKRDALKMVFDKKGFKYKGV